MPFSKLKSTHRPHPSHVPRSNQSFAPQRAVRLLGLTPKNHTIGTITLKYVTVDDVMAAFQKHGYALDLSTNNGDEFESYLCKWQKNIK